MRLMRLKNSRIGLIILVFSSFLLLPGCVQDVEKPVQNGSGPLALQLEAEEEDRIAAVEDGHHNNKVEQWRKVHMSYVNISNPSGIEEQCSDCHDEPSQFCDHCHNYVGVKTISAVMKTKNQ